MGRKSAAEAAGEVTLPRRAGRARDRAREQPLEGLLDRVRSITPLIASRARAAERERKPDDEVVEALEASGVFRSFVPRRFGGYEIGVDLFVDIGVAVGEACPSTGWITTFYMEHNCERIKFGTRRVQGQGAATRIRLANALAEVRAAETVLRAAAGAMEAHARREAELSPLAQLELRLTIAHVVRDCCRVVRNVMEGSGASVHYLDHELQRISRDVQMMSAHTVFDVDLAAEQCGRARLESDAPLFPLAR